MTDKTGVVRIYDAFIKDNPEENVFIHRHPRDEDDLICMITTVKVFQQMFPSADLRPRGEVKNGKVDDSSKKEDTSN